jgi:hypothetical protein
MTKEELKEKIEAYEEIINDPSEDQTTRDFAAKKVAKLKDQIAPGYSALSDTADDEEIEVEEMEEEEVEEVVEEKPKKAPKKKKTTKKKGRGRPKKRGRPAKRKATKKAVPTKAKAKKMSKDLGLSVKECEDLLEKYNSEDKARKSRLAKRKKAGKSPDLSVSESLEKEVKTVKNKVEDKKTPTTKAQAKSQGSKITDLVKAILEGIDKKKDKITQIDAIIKGLVAEKKKIMAKKGTGAFLVGSALGGYAGYKIGLSKDKTALKDLFKGEKKLAKDFKDAVKDKKKKDETYTEFEEIYAKGGKIDRDEPIVEFMVNTGDREHLSLFRPAKFSTSPITVEDLKKMNEENIIFMMYGGEDAEMTDYGVDIGDSYVRVDSIMTMGEYIDRGYAKGGVTQNAKWEYPIYFNSDDKEFVAIYYSHEEDVNEADEDFDNRTANDLTPDVIKEYVEDTSSSKSNYKFEERDVYEFSKNDRFMDDLGYALETSSISPEKVYAKGGKTEGEPFVGYLDKAEDGENFQHILEEKGMFEQVGGQYIKTAPEDDVKEFYEDRFEADTSGHKSRYAKGGKTPKFKVRKSFYDKTIGANKKTGTGEDMRSVYHLHIEGTGYGQNYLIDSKTATDEFLEENAPGGYDKGFYVDEEVYVDFTDKDGNKKKGYMIVNNPDLAVRILRDKYNAVSIEDMLTEWEMDDKGKNLDDYTDSY